MITLGIILLFFFLIALLRFGVNVEYSHESIRLKLLVGPFSINAYPVKEKPGDKEKKEKKKAKKKEKDEKEKPPFKMPGGLKGFLEMIAPVKNMLRRLKRRILVKKIIIHLTLAGTDASKTAMMYGGANVVFGLITPILENNFRVKKRDFTTNVDFLNTEQKIYLNMTISLAVWESMYIVFALFPILKILLKRQPDDKKQKAGGYRDKNDTKIDGKDEH